MSAPRLTLPLIASALPFIRFRRAIKAAIETALAAPTLNETLNGLTLAPYQEGDERMGWAYHPDGGEGHAFIGVYTGPETVHPDTPDLYFYLEVPRGSAEQEAVDARRDEIAAVVAQLNAMGLNVYWGHSPGGTHGLWAVMSLLDALRSGKPDVAIVEFVLHTFTHARATGLMALFFGPSYGAIAENASIAELAP